jgi:GNAT superfamily N-acetyltransferase
MRVYTARDDGRLVGYNAFFMRPSIHYRGSLQASNDVIFLLPEYRKGGVGRGLIEYGDACLRNEGCQVVMHHVKVNHDWTPLLARMGYEKQDIICSKRLDKDH